MKTLRILLAASCFSAFGLAALADTPAFVGTLDGASFVPPTVFPVEIGSIFVSAQDVFVGDDITCDALSTHALYVDSPMGAQPFEVRFQHDHAGIGTDSHLAERETFALKLGVERTDSFGMKVGFQSVGGHQVFPIQFGPASPGSADPRYGEMYVNGEPTGIRYANLFAATCNGPNRMDAQVLVSFDMLGMDGIYFVTIQSNAPYPQRKLLGPFDIPDAVMEEGYGACCLYGQSGTGRALADGPECLVAAPLDLLPIVGRDRTHRNLDRR